LYHALPHITTSREKFLRKISSGKMLVSTPAAGILEYNMMNKYSFCFLFSAPGPKKWCSSRNGFILPFRRFFEAL
jgi:hypothetical protein